MADSLAVEIQTRLRWLFSDSLDLSTVADSSGVEYEKNLADGTSVDQVDKIWHDQRTVAATSNDDLDLTALTNSVFGSTITINFAKVKSILVVNTSTTSGDELRVGAAASNAFTAPFNGGATSVVEVGADSALLLSSNKDGWSVTGGSADVLRIANPGGNSITYKIVIVGTSS
ncbi:MAG: hypothetical protein KDA63_02865 [Planctomycetales bacterium]|nr:hypothetical protein [Planctomycetales bacterium]